MDEPATPEAATQDAQEVLERFVIDNDDLLDLEARIGRFNIFDALGIARAEIRHSNFLAFILDPAESHGQGELFLRAILMDLFKKAPPSKRPFSPIHLDGADFRGVEVKREWKHTDLFIKCEEPSFVVVVENKIGAKEGPEQLTKYRERVEAEHPGALYVFLNANATPPSDKNWLPYSYEEMHGVLTRVKKTNSIGEDVVLFLDHYLSLIGTRFMSDPEIDKLCRQIYKNHRQAIKLIVERGGPASSVLSEIEDVLRNEDRWTVDPRSSCILFAPKEWSTWLPPLGPKNDSQWIYVHLHLYEDGTLGYFLEMAPMAESAKRIEICKKLLERCAEFGFKRPKAKEVKNAYSRISSFETIMKLGEDEEADLAKVHNASAKAIAALYPKCRNLASF